MKKHVSFLLMAIFLAISGFSQNLLNEGFEGTTFPPANWTLIQGSANYWGRSTAYYNTGSASAFVNWSSGSLSWLITPPLSPETGDSIVFYYAANYPNYAEYTDFSVVALTSIPNSSSAVGTTLQTISSPTSTFTRLAISLEDYVGQSIYIGFRFEDNGGTGIAIDDISGVHLSSCMPPSNFAVSNVTQDGASFSWSENGESTEWTLYLKKSTDTVYTEYTSTDSTYDVSELDPGTLYSAYVVANCDDDELSAASASVNFNTLAVPVTEFPYSQDFENSENITEFVVTGSGINQWTIGSAANCSADTTVTGNALYVSNDNGVSNAYTNSGAVSTSYASMRVEFGDASEYHLSFDYRVNGEGTSTRYDYLAVYVLDTNQSLSVIPATSISASSTDSNRLMWDNLRGSVWQHYLGAIPGATNSVKDIVFVWRNDGSSGVNPPAAIDNINIVASECVTPPIDLAVSDITENSATLAWTEQGTATNWTVYVKKDTENGYTDYATTETSYDLTDLDVNTSYIVYVVSNCSDDDNSVPASIINFRTLCSTIDITEETPYIKTFDDNHLFDCWTVMNGFTYNSISYPRVYNSNAHASTYALQMSTDNSSIYVPVMVASPTFNNDLNTLRMKFYAKFTRIGDKLAVGYVTDLADTSTFVGLDTIVSTSTYTYSEIIQSFASAPEEGYMVIKYIPKTYNTYFYIDDVTIELLPDCAGPDLYSLVVVPSGTEATATFTDADESHDSWTVYYKKTSEEEYSTYETDATTFTLTGLDPTTEYVMYVRTNCGEEVSVDSTIAVTFTTTGIPITEFPYEQTFEDESQTFTEFFIGGTGSNQWAIGSAANYPVTSADEEADTTTTGHALYVSNDNGVTNAYSTGTTSFSYAMMQVQFEDAEEYNFSFDYRVNGEGTSTRYDYLAVYMIDGAEDISVIPTTNLTSSSDSTNRLMYDNLNGTTWKHYETALTGVANTTKNIIFVWRNDSGAGDQPPAAVDNISISVSECSIPDSLVVSAVAENSATFSWTETGDATQWTIYYKKVTEDTYSSQIVTENPYELTDLDAGSFYEAYLVANCAADVQSIATDVIDFQTLCAEITIDEDNPTFSDSFEDRMVLGCWTAVGPTLTYSSKTWPNIYTSYYYEGSHSLALSPSTYNSYYGLVSTKVATPQFTNDINTLRVKFHSYFSSTNDRLVVGYMTDLTDSTTFVAVDTLSQATSSHTLHIVSFGNAESATDAYIVFQYVPGSTATYNYGLYLDNIEVSLIPDCAGPTYNSLTASGATSSSVNGSFSDPDPTHNSWKVYYKKVTDEEYSTEEITDTTFTLEDLDPSSQYEMYVRTNCGDEVSFDSTDAVAFATFGLPVTEFPYYQSFENADSITEFYISGSGPNQWTIGTATGNNTDGAETTTSLYISNDNGINNAYTITSTSISYAAIQLEFGDASEYHLSFDYLVNGEGTSTRFDYLAVYVLDTNQSLSVIPATSISASSTDSNRLMCDNLRGSVWQHYLGAIPGATNSVKDIVFVWRNDGSSGVNPPAAIDNISIVGSECPKPLDLVVSDVTNTNATLSWTEQGDATNWTIYLKKTTEDTYTEYAVTENPYEFTQLDPKSSYEAYVVSNCSDEEMSLQSNYVTFRTTAEPISEFPYIQTFEDSTTITEFDLTGGTVNQWIFGGSATAMLGEDETEGHSMYISNDNGVSNAYTTNTSDNSFAIMLVQFGDASEYDLEFDYQVQGETGYDFLSVYLVDDTTNYLSQNDALMYRSAMQNGWQHVQYALTGVANTSKKIIFHWRNDGGAGTQPPAAIDNISIVAVGDTTGGDTTIVNCNDTTVYLPQVTLCEGETYTFGTQTINASGTYTRTLTRACGDADSVISVTVVVNPTYNEQVAATINEGESYTFGSQTLTTAGTYVDTLQTVNGCDSTITLTLTVIADTTGGDTTIVNCNDTTIYLPQVTLCEGETYTFGTQTINASGTYTRTLTRACGDADSVISVTVVVNPTYNEQVAATINEGESYTFGSQTLTTAGTYVDTLQTVNGCDSVITLTLTVNVVIVNPTVTTLAATNIGQTSATINGQVSGGNQTITDQGFVYRVSGATDSVKAEANGENMSLNLINLICGTEYTYYAYATTENGETITGENRTFTTSECDITAPTVTTLSASEISDHNATLNGQVTVGSEEILEQGFEYKESTASSWQTIAANDNFTATINNLTSGTTYTFRAYVTTATDTYRGSDMTFTTTSGLLDVTDNVIISAYPNPTVSDVTLEIEGLTEDAQIILTDVQGKTISEQLLPANQTTMTISTNSLSSGVYYIRVITDNMTRVEKLIKR